jgi:integrase
MIYRRKGSKTWWMKFQVRGVLVRESTDTESKTLAKDIADERRRKLVEGIHGIRRQARAVLFSKAASDWLEGRKHEFAPKTAELYELCLSHLKPHFGKLLLADISPDDIRAYQAARLRAGAAGRSVNMEISVLRQVLRQHKLWTRLADEVKSLKENRDVGRALTPEEEQRLLKAAADRRYGDCALYPVVVLALNTAMRRGEILNLHWRDVDLKARTITIHRGKTDAARRVVPLNQNAATVLDFWRSRFPNAKPEHFVFPANEQHHTDPTQRLKDVRSGWRNAVRAAKLGRLRFHDLRHTAITKLAEGQASDSTILAVAGHCSRRMLEHYSHIRMDAKRKALEAIPQVEIDQGWAQFRAQSQDEQNDRVQ